jgi:quercetin dioxygenase-like cupin family protein
MEVEDRGDHDRTIRRLGHWGSDSWIPFSTHDHGGRHRRAALDPVSVVLGSGDLVLPHSHRDEDELSFVFRGRTGGRIGDHDVTVEEGGFLFKPRGIVHTIWNSTDIEATVLEFLSPAGLEDFFER